MRDEVPRHEYTILSRKAKQLKETLPAGLPGRVEKKQIPTQYALYVEVPESPHALFTKFMEWCRRNDIYAEKSQ